jgi:putative salt-induced outer membrane protein
LTSNVAAFIALSGLRDRFQGLDLRLNLDPGLALYFVEVPKHRFWLEAGYDFQYDLRRRSAIREARAENIFLDRAETRHSLRGFLGYENNLSESVTFDTGFEYLQALAETENSRINWDVGLTSRIQGNFSVAVTFNLRYDNNPLPGVEKTDYTSALSLVYQVL